MPTPDGTATTRSAEWTDRRIAATLAAVVLAQAGWLSWLISRGWYYQDDFTFLSQATGQHLGWGYLTRPLNGHLVPGVRLCFWLLQHFAPLEHSLTLGVRVLLQALSTLLLYRLLTELTGQRGKAVTVTAVYAFCPLLVPGSLWLSSAVNLLPAQALVLLGYLAHLRYYRTGQLRWSAYTGLALVAAASFWEKSAVTAVLLPVLSLGFLTEGPARARLADLARRWRGWLAAYLPLALFVGYFVLAGYGSTSSRSGLMAGPRLAWAQWRLVLWPSALGGPWQWFHEEPVYASVSNAGMPAQVAGQAAFVIVLVLAWRRLAWRGLLAAALPALSVGIGMTLVSAGRYDNFGSLSARVFSYAFDLAVPLSIAVCLVWSAEPSGAEPSGAEPSGAEPPGAEPSGAEPSGAHRRPWPLARWVSPRLAVAAVAVVLIASSMASSLLWSQTWSENPSRYYVKTLSSQLAKAGPAVNLYDTALPLNIVPFVNSNRHISDLLAMAHLHAGFDSSASEPQVVDGSGRIRPAVFFPVARMAPAQPSFCDHLLRGNQPLTVPLIGSVSDNEYFLRIEFFQQRLTAVTVTVRDGAGAVIPLVNGPSVRLGSTLGFVIARLGSGSPASVRISSDNAATNTCITAVLVGMPFVKQ